MRAPGACHRWWWKKQPATRVSRARARAQVMREYVKALRSKWPVTHATTINIVNIDENSMNFCVYKIGTLCFPLKSTHATHCTRSLLSSKSASPISSSLQIIMSKCVTDCVTRMTGGGEEAKQASTHARGEREGRGNREQRRGGSSFLSSQLSRLGRVPDISRDFILILFLFINIGYLGLLFCWVVSSRAWWWTGGLGSAKLTTENSGLYFNIRGPRDLGRNCQHSSVIQAVISGFLVS